ARSPGNNQPAQKKLHKIVHVVTSDDPLLALALPRFDNSRGTLVRVQYEFTARPRRAGWMENRSCCDQDIYISVQYRSNWYIQNTAVHPTHTWKYRNPRRPSRTFWATRTTAR